MKELSNRELGNKAREYDREHNDGGEGYNPYRNEMDRRAAASAPRDRYAILKDLEKEDNAAMRGSGLFDQAKVDALRAELAALDAAKDAAFKAEWPKEVFEARKAEWNEFVKSLIGPNGKIDEAGQRAVLDRQRDQGWSIDDLKRAIKLYK